MRRPGLLYVGWPILLAAAFVLTKYLDEGVPAELALRPILWAVALSGLVIAMSTALLRDRPRAGLLAGSIVLLEIAHGNPVLIALAITGATLVATSVLLRSHGQFWDRSATGLNRLLALTCAALLGVTLAQFAVRGQLADYGEATATGAECDGCPDIWIVLLDGYPRRDSLLDRFGIDNSKFINSLEALGFEVATRSRSNYRSTDMTLPSMLNLAPLDQIPPFANAPYPRAAPASQRWRALQDNRAFEMLRARGYETIAIGAGYSRTDLRSADRFVDVGTADVIELHLLADSTFGSVADMVAPTHATGEVRKRIESNLAVLAQIAQESSARPQFVFAHIPGPHSPNVFGRDGLTAPARLESLFHQSGAEDDPAAYREDYARNLERLNDLVLAALRDITSGAGDAVIVVMSDHGSRSRGYLDTLTKADVNEQFATLFAARTRDQGDLFGDVVTPVNVLPTIFDHYLGTNLPRWPHSLEGLVGEHYANPDEP